MQASKELTRDIKVKRQQGLEGEEHLAFVLSLAHCLLSVEG